MEVGVRLLGVFLRLLNFLLEPLFRLFAGDHGRVPPITNPILLKSATQLAAAVRNCDIKSEEIVRVYINRVKEVNPLLNAVVDERYRAALDEAKAVDRDIERAKQDGTFDELIKDRPLLGVPFTVKESCQLAGMSNSVGCLENAGRRATADGAAVQLVRRAGGIPLLVSNTPELCLGWETSNLLRGTTSNPHCLARTAGGSSGGEAALLASGASAMSVASDVAGSIRLPAAFCGVFGHKPTPGFIPIEGHIPTLNDELFPKLLTVGPMTRSAEDLTLLMNIMAGEKRHQLKLDQEVDIKNIKVHYMTEATMSPALIDVDKSIKDSIKAAAHYLERECGATVSEEKFKDFDDSVEMSVAVFFSMKDIPNMLQDPADPKRNKNLLVELIKSAFGGGSRSLQGLGFTFINKTRLFISESRTSYYKDKTDRLREKIQSTLGDDGVLLYPVFSSPAHRHHEVFLKVSGVMYTMLFNVVGAPATTVPVGTREGLPLAIQVIAAPGRDRLCLAVARQLEAGFGGWTPPH